MHNFFLVNIQNNMHASPIFHFTIFFLMIILRNNAWLRQSLFRNQRFMLDEIYISQQVASNFGQFL